MRFLIHMVTLFLSGIALTSGYAYELEKENWNWLEQTPKAVSVWVHTNCIDPPALPSTTQLAAIESAWITWNSVATNFRFEYGGESNVLNFTRDNGQNDICWNSGSNPNNPRAGASTKTWLMGGCSACKSQCDIVFWDGPFVWSTGSVPGLEQVDVESVALHEPGHILGLDHSTISGAVMYRNVGMGETRRELSIDDSDGLKAIYGLVITIPNGSNTWNVGTSYSITWDHEGVSGNVDIFLNRDYPDPNKWGKIIANIVNDGSEDWISKTPVSTDCRIRVESANHRFVYDASDANFTIAGYTVTNPNASGITWEEDSEVTINWTSLSMTGNVDILLNRDYPNENGWVTLFSNMPDDHYQFWTVAPGTSTTCRIMVRRHEEVSNLDISDNDFSIIHPTR